jgi:hypothetical protein
MTRIYHPWNKWEAFRHNFYGGIMEYQKDDTLQLYASLLRDLSKFEAALRVIIRDWKYSCEHNLTNEGMNRIAWLGQASCALVYQVPATISMGGYNLLTKEEQQNADKMAEKYLNLWLEQHEPIKKVS